MARNKSDNQYRKGMARRGFFGRFFLSKKDITGAQKNIAEIRTKDAAQVDEKLMKARKKLEELLGPVMKAEVPRESEKAKPEKILAAAEEKKYSPDFLIILGKNAY